MAVRTFFTGLLTLTSMVAIVLALPSLWVKERLVDREGFVATVSAAARDQEVKDYLADQVASAAVEQTGRQAVGLIVAPVARAYTNTSQFEADFADIASQQHAWLFDPPPSSGDTSVMELDITGMLNRVIANTGLDLTVTGPILVPLNQAGSGLEAGRYYQVGRQITAMAYGSLVVAVIAGAMALVIARRRGTVVVWLGIGLICSAVFAWAVGVFFADRAKQEVVAVEDAGRTVAEVIVDGAVDDLHHLALIVAVAGVGVVVAGVVTRVLVGRR